MQTKTRNELVFPRSYAENVVKHAKRQHRRGRNPSESFLGERNPKKALAFAYWVLSLPDNGVIRDRLIGLQKHLPGQDELLYAFGEYLASHVNPNLIPSGFVLATELAIYDLERGIDSRTGKKIRGRLSGQMPLTYSLLRLSVPEIAQAIFPDDFAMAIAGEIEEINTMVAIKNAVAKASAPAPKLPDDPLTVYTAVRRIADIGFEVWREAEDRWMSLEDRRGEKVNPFYDQTTGGIFIEQYYGIPGSIWTPWGKYDCWGGGSGSDELMKKFLNRIGKVELAVPERNTEMGTISPIYAVLQVGDIVLPKPERRERLSYIEYEEANRLWAEVEAMYK